MNFCFGDINFRIGGIFRDEKSLDFPISKYPNKSFTLIGCNFNEFGIAVIFLKEFRLSFLLLHFCTFTILID